MIINPYKQTPKSIKIFLWAAGICGISYLILLYEWVISSTNATWIIAGAFAICLVYGLPLSLFTSRFIIKPFGTLWKAIFYTILLFLIGGVLGLASSYAHEYLPAGTWYQLELPPEPLTELVTTLPIGILSGGIYGRTASADLYLHNCAWGNCRWSKEEQLPIATDYEGYWSGKCYNGLQKPPRFILKPPVPGPVIDSYATRYCGPDYHQDTFFLLLNDGSVWSWQTFWSIYTLFMYQSVWAVLGSILAIVWGWVKR